MSKNNRPPQLLLRFFRWFCHPKLRDHIEGDLTELYNEQVNEIGKRRADLKFIGDVLLLFRPGIIKAVTGYKNFNNYDMIRSYFTIAWRTLVRNKAFSFINIGGLSLGLTCSMLIFLWVADEMNVDTFNSNKDVYNVYERIFSEGKVDAGPWAPGQLAAELKQRIPEIKYASGFWIHEGETLFNIGEKRIQFKGCAADSDFFKMFNYELLQGSAATALNDPDAIAISRKMAEIFFGTPEAAFGNMIRMDNRKEFKITAVFENVPSNASHQVDFVSNWHDLLESVQWLKSWIYRGPFTYVQLHQGADLASIENKIKDFLTPFLTADHNGEGYRTELGLQAYSEMYLHSTFENGVPKGGRIEYVKLFSLIAILILLIACINFMNLATARSVKRAKEVGVRKTVGAIRFFLISQFIGEAMLIAFLALVLALVVTASLLPSFNLLTNKQIAMPLTSLPFWGSLIALLLVTGFIAGSYPAFFLSSLNSVKVLKGSLKVDPNTLLFRKALVVLQFTVSIMMIAGAIVVSQQLYFIQSKNLGFDKENLLYIPLQGDLINKYEVFREQLLNRPGIQNVTRSTNAPSHINTHEYDLEWEGKSQDEKVIAIHNGIGYDFLSMMNIPLLQGRNFSKDFISDSSGFIINETALKTIGYKDPIGKPLKFFQRNGTIIGVVKDFHLKSLREPIKPLILFLGEHASWGYVLIKTQPGKTQDAIASVEQVFKQLEPEFLLRYYFADEEYQKLYQSEQTVSKLTDSFSVIAILISCLGLLGLTIFTVEQRRKEIGVRKVLGANIGHVVNILSRDIVKLVIIAALIATPVAWFALSRWLSDFAYKVSINWWLFLLVALATMGVAMITLSYHTIKAAIANPVNSLKSE